MAKSVYRPAADVFRDLVRDATPRVKREKRRHPSMIEIYAATVTLIRTTAGVSTAELAITLSDRIRLDVAARAFVNEGAKTKRKFEGEVTLPFRETVTGITLTAQIGEPPAGLVPGAVISSARVTFALDAMADMPTLIALADTIILDEEEIVIAPISLGICTLGPLPPIEGVDDDPIAQAKMERWLVAALAYQDKQRARRR